jgi:phage-related holin
MELFSGGKNSNYFGTTAYASAFLFGRTSIPRAVLYAILVTAQACIKNIIEKKLSSMYHFVFMRTYKIEELVSAVRIIHGGI